MEPGKSECPLFMASGARPTWWMRGFQPCCNNIDDSCLVLTHKGSRWGSVSDEEDINPMTALCNLWPFRGCCLKVIGWVSRSQGRRNRDVVVGEHTIELRPLNGLHNFCSTVKATLEIYRLWFGNHYKCWTWFLCLQICGMSISWHCNKCPR